MLPLTFADPTDYDKITGADIVDIVGLENGGFRSGVPLTLVVKTPKAATSARFVNHTFNDEQITEVRARIRAQLHEDGQCHQDLKRRRVIDGGGVA